MIDLRFTRLRKKGYHVLYKLWKVKHVKKRSSISRKIFLSEIFFCLFWVNFVAVAVTLGIQDIWSKKFLFELNFLSSKSPVK